jgi:hypothetical protein
MTFRRPTLIAVTLWTAALRSVAAEPAVPAKIHAVAPAASPLAAQPLDRFSATRDRPLFSPTRHPPAVAAVAPAPPPPPPPPPNVALLGVVMDGEQAQAVIRAGPTAKVLRVSIGDDIGGWKVGQIEERKLVLLLNGRTATFTMFSGNNVKHWPNATTAAPHPAANQTAPNEPPSPVPASRRPRPRHPQAQVN